MIGKLLARLNLDPYVLSLLGTVALASVMPAQGTWAFVADRVTDFAIALLFFLHGARLSRQAVIDGARAWKLHLSVASLTYVLFPLLGLAIQALPFLPVPLARGMLFLSLLPSTVQSSIAFTSMAGGNVAAAVCSASFSNLAGIVLTPLMTALLITGRSGGFSSDPVVTIATQLLLPFLAGHLLRPWIAGFVARHKRFLGYTDKGSILLVVYTAFSAAVLGGLWSRVTLGDIAEMVVLSLVLLALVMGAAQALGRIMGFSREDRVVLLFCGSKKSLATGVPLAGVLFAADQVGAIVLPLMIFHQVQLMVCAVMARRMGEQRSVPAGVAPVT